MSKIKKTPPKVELSAKAVKKENKVFAELVIKEIMVQKQVDRDKAIKILEAHK